MELFQEFFIKALLALLFACVIAKLIVSVALYGDDKAAGKVEVVEKQRNLDKKVLRISKNVKRVKFSDDVMVKHVDYKYEVEEERRDFDREIRSVVNSCNDYDVCDDGSGSSGTSVESMEEVIVEETSEKCEILERVDGVDDHRVIVEETNEKGEILKRVGGIDDHGVIVEETSEKEILKRVDGVDDQRVIVEETNEKGEILKRVDGVDDHRVIVEEKSENGESSTSVDRVVVEDQHAIVEEVSEKYEILKRVDQVEDQKVIVEEKSEKGEILKRVDQVDDQRVIEDGIVIDCSDEIVGVHGDDGEKVYVNIVSLGEALVREVVEEKSDDVAIGLKEESGVPELEGDEEEEEEEEEEGKVKDEGVVIDDDWEGIERTELEKRFGSVVNHVECGVKPKDDRLANLGTDVQMHLYGLHKIAVEGPCHEPQPMALNFSARAKWNAWQKLGSMSREVAMEEYIKLLSEHSRSSFPDIQPNVISD